MKSRRRLVVAVGMGALAAPFGASAQAQEKVRRIGFMSARTQMGPSEEDFRQGLRDLGYVEGKNIVVEWRFSAGKSKAYREFALELVRLKVDCIVAFGLDAAMAAKLATSTIPIVMVSVNDDPVRRGLVASLARPGGNVTGFVVLGPDLAGKRLQLLKEILPQATRMAIIWDGTSAASAGHVKETESAARVLGVQLQSLDVGDARALEKAFQSAVAERVQAIVVVATGFLNAHQVMIANLAADAKLPAIYTSSQLMRAGGLMSYAADGTEQFRGAASHVAKILRGAKPGELPVQQPTRFEFQVSMKAAKRIGLTIPPSLLARADKVVE